MFKLFIFTVVKTEKSCFEQNNAWYTVVPIWGSTPDPTGWAYSAPPGPLAGLNGPTSKGRNDGKEGKGRREGRKSRGKEKKGVEGNGSGKGLRHGCWGWTPPVKTLLDCTPNWKINFFEDDDTVSYFLKSSKIIPSVAVHCSLFLLPQEKN